MVNEKYTVNGISYDLKEAVALIKSGKWDSAIKKIMKSCNVKEDVARQVGKTIKSDLAAYNENVKKNMENLVSDLIVTSGPNIEGYRIQEYLGVISGESVLGSDFLTKVAANWDSDMGAESTAFSDKITLARKQAYKKIIKSAAESGGNAIIELKYDYFTIGSNLICVCAQGTAVVIEKTTEF